MKSPVIFNTRNNNNYFYSLSKSQFFLAHPIFNYLLRLSENKAFNVENWYEALPNSVKIEGYREVPKNELEYYKNKYLLFKDKGYFDDEKLEDQFETKLKKDIILSNIMNSVDIVFEVTQNCNLNCTYCAYNELYEGYEERSNVDLSYEKAIKIIDYVCDLYNSNYNYSVKKELNIGFYGGEPLLKFEFVRNIVNYIKTNHKDVEYMSYNMTTNGLLLHKHIDFLVENKFDLLISLDGNKEHNSYRLLKNGKTSFDLVFENIKQIQSKYPDYYKQYVSFNSVLHNRNSMSEMRNFFDKEFNKFTRVSELATNSINKANKETFKKMYKRIIDDEEKQKNEPIIKKRREYGENFDEDLILLIKRNSGYIYKDLPDLMFSDIKDRIIPTGTCTPFSRKIFVLTSGKILQCERIAHQHCLGEITEKGVEIDYDFIIKKFRTYYENIIKYCQKCYNAYNCPQCILQIDDIDEPNFTCSYFTNKNDFEESISTIYEDLEENKSAYNKIIKTVKII